ncbi:hypothetical protein M5C99_06125 [Acidovorax sp. NCPPB 2350]|nr:hypothetical protein M5C99_06125 [Acidovorax sp. NCPPB 2350]
MKTLDPENRIYRSAKSIPLLLLMLAIAIYTMASVASSMQELPPKWLRAYQYMPAYMAYALLGLHTVLTPGAGLLAYAVPLVRFGEEKSKLIAGILLLLYYPARLFLLFILIGIFPLWLVFEILELLFFIRIGKRTAEKRRIGK